jgi:hypothetical protein
MEQVAEKFASRFRVQKVTFQLPITHPYLRRILPTCTYKLHAISLLVGSSVR